jgi:hypothetical protein
MSRPAVSQSFSTQILWATSVIEVDEQREPVTKLPAAYVVVLPRVRARRVRARIRMRASTWCDLYNAIVALSQLSYGPRIDASRS